MEATLNRETIWLTQEQIAQIFSVKRPAITKHLLNIFETGELDQESVRSILEHTAADCKSYATQFFIIDAMIAESKPAERELMVNLVMTFLTEVSD